MPMPFYDYSLAENLLKLKDLAQSWGGDVREISQDGFDALKESARNKAFPAFFDSPFTSYDLGIIWTEKKVVYTEKARLSGKMMWGHILHEMGHVFASTEEPDRGNEFDFFGWEYAVVHHLQLDEVNWDKAQQDYCIEYSPGCSGVYYMDYGQICRPGAPAVHRTLFLAERLQEARKLGLLNDDFTPKAIR